MNNLSDNIDQFFPNVISETSGTFYDFFRVYIEFLDKVNNNDVLSRIDVDHVADLFLINLKREYLRDIPMTNNVHTLTSPELKLLLREAISLNKSKGTIASIVYLFRVLFHSRLEVEFGRYGVYQEYKPDDFEVEFVDAKGNVIDDYWNAISAQPYYVSNDQQRTGISVTYFKNYDTNTNHIWTLVDATIRDGDILFFYKVNKYVRVKATNRLELDGWLNKLSRWKDENDFYVLNEINPRLYDVFYMEMCGFNVVIPQSYYERNTRYKFHMFFNKGRVELYLYDEPTEVGTFTRSLYATKNDKVYKCTVEFTTSSTGITSLKLNGANQSTFNLRNNRAFNVCGTDFYNCDGEQGVTQNYLDDARQLLAAFSIFFKTDIDPTDYMRIIRLNTVPAGYRTIHIFMAAQSLLGNIAVTYPVPDNAPYNEKVPVAIDTYEDKLYNTKRGFFNYRIKYYDSHSANPLPPYFLDDPEFVASPWFKAFYGTLENCLWPARIRIMDEINHPELYYSETIYSETMPSVRAHIHYTGDNPRYPAPSLKDLWANFSAFDDDRKVYTIEYLNDLCGDEFTSTDERSDVVYTVPTFNKLRYSPRDRINYSEIGNKAYQKISYKQQTYALFDLVGLFLGAELQNIDIPYGYILDEFNLNIDEQDVSDDIKYKTWITTNVKLNILTHNKPYDLFVDFNINEFDWYLGDVINRLELDSFDSNERVSDYLTPSMKTKINTKGIIKDGVVYSNNYYTKLGYLNKANAVFTNIESYLLDTSNVNNVSIDSLGFTIDNLPKDEFKYVAWTPVYTKINIGSKNKPYDLLSDHSVDDIGLYYDVDTVKNITFDQMDQKTRLSDVLTHVAKLKMSSVYSNKVGNVYYTKYYNKIKHNSSAKSEFDTFESFMFAGGNQPIGMSIDDFGFSIDEVPTGQMRFNSYIASNVKVTHTSVNKAYDVFGDQTIDGVPVYYDVNTLGNYSINVFDESSRMSVVVMTSGFVSSR